MSGEPSCAQKRSRSAANMRTREELTQEKSGQDRIRTREAKLIEGASGQRKRVREGDEHGV